MFKLPVRLALWLFTLVLFGYNFYIWGGAYQIDHVGKLLLKDAKQSPVLVTYMVVGDKIDGTLGKRAQAKAAAEKEFESALARPDLLEFSASTRMKGAQSGFGAFAYWFAWVMLVLSGVAHFLREKQVKSLGAR